MGTRLEWKIGPAPSNLGNFWQPYAHVIQGGLKDAVPGGADVAGYAYYANTYTGWYNGNTKASLGLRYRYKDFLEAGITIPSGVTTTAPLFNFTFMILPVDVFAASVAYEGVLQGNGNFYTGLSLYLSNFFLMHILELMELVEPIMIPDLEQMPLLHGVFLKLALEFALNLDLLSGKM